MSDFIPVLDFGGQYAHLITRRLRDLGAHTRIINPKDYELEKDQVAGIILSGGPRSVAEQDSPGIPKAIQHLIESRSVPILGICYGHQIIVDCLGGRISKSSNREYGRVTINITAKSVLYGEQERSFQAWMSHGDHVTRVPDGFQATSSSSDCPVTSMESADGMIISTQFHLEVTHTENGQKMLQRFLQLCSIEPRQWSIEEFVEDLIDDMRNLVKNEMVILGISGGVDSLVAAKILRLAIKEKLHLIFINHGMLRKGEVEYVLEMFDNLKFNNIHYIDASKEFLKKLDGITGPEDKRKIIGHTFIEVFEKKSDELRNKFGEIRYLAQGTIFSDRVESGSTGTATAKIKSHHNLTLPDVMKLEILEPLKDLYKDEVRELGTILGIPERYINRHPFPGPGLAIRILGAVTEEKIRLLQEADRIFRDELERGNGYNSWQAFAVLLSGKAVGVQGDNKSYGRIICLRSVESHDGMTADFSRLPWDVLANSSSKIINTIPEITRVVYDISTKPPATIEFE